MTVCVAAICNNNTVIGASDRMLSTIDVQFEPGQTKIFQLTPSIVVLMADSAQMQAEVLAGVSKDVQARVSTQPTNWWLIRDVADLYSKHYNEARLKRAVSHILAPLGMDIKSFLSKQKDLSPELSDRLTTRLFNFEAHGVEAIIAGVDQDGPHIYVARNHEVFCHDAVGFASIGSGRWHADAQFTFSAYSRFEGLPKALVVTYFAKRRAEVAPGVGKVTDMFSIGPAVGSYQRLPPEFQEGLRKVYEDLQKEQARLIGETEPKFVEYALALTNAPPTSQQMTAATTSSVATTSSTGTTAAATGPPAATAATATTPAAGTTTVTGTVPAGIDVLDSSSSGI